MSLPEKLDKVRGKECFDESSILTPYKKPTHESSIHKIIVLYAEEKRKGFELCFPGRT